MRFSLQTLMMPRGEKLYIHMNSKTRHDVENIQEVAWVTRAPADLWVNTNELLLETVPPLMGITGGSPAVNLVAECWGQLQSLRHVLRAGAILSRSPVVHGYKSHHQLSEHPQPASSPPDWWRNGGKKINGFLSFSAERATSVLFSSLMSSRSAVGNWKLSLNKLTDANGKKSLVSIQRLLSIWPSLPCRGEGFGLRKKETLLKPFGEDDSDPVEFLFDDSRLSKGPTGSYVGDTPPPPRNSGLAAAIILITALTRYDLAAKLRNQQGSLSISLRHILVPAPNGKFKYHISAECNIHLAGDKSAARVSFIWVKTDAVQSLTLDLTGKL